MRIGDESRAHIVRIGRSWSIHRRVSSFVASEIQAFLGTPGAAEGCDAGELVDLIRERIWQDGSDALDTGLRRASDDSRAHIVRIGRSDDGTRRHRLALRQTSRLPIPGIAGPTRLLSSRTGDRAIVVWTEDDDVFYRESNGEQWGEATSIGVDVTGDAGVLELVRQRLDRH